jgi:hypothetical protein
VKLIDCSVVRLNAEFIRDILEDDYFIEAFGFLARSVVFLPPLSLALLDQLYLERVEGHFFTGQFNKYSLIFLEVGVSDSVVEGVDFLSGQVLTSRVAIVSLNFDSS